ncbi:MAG TPA: GNAT family N-acetyltransferase, partial [Azospirillaceae bacterium]|nr:GNAT family N-acetyltransferase [Azospirillaceae bacterium]
AAVMTVRLVTYLDAEFLGALHAACFPDDVWDGAAMAALLATPGTWGLIAADGTCSPPEPAGLILCRSMVDEAEILTFGVRLMARRRGVGRVLLNAALRHAQAQGVAQVFLEVAEDNLPARSLYADSGFAQVGRRSGYYQKAHAPALDALVLMKDLLANEY